MSWSAITQIESGRRTDLRLTTLSALADALEVSVDYLIGTAAATSPPQLLEHRVLTYGSDEEYLATATPFLAEGVERSHCLLAVTTARHISLLRETLDEGAPSVEFADSGDWYQSPGAALSQYRAFVQEKFDGGAVWIRILADADWAGSSDAEIAAWTRYESMVNLAFASSPATIICTYDTELLPAAFVADARHTHPELARAEGKAASPAYQMPEEFLLE